MKFNFHTIKIGDVEDPEIYIADPILQWQQTEHGKWVMENASDLTYCRQSDDFHLGYKFVIRGSINDAQKVTEYLLRWGK